MVTVIRRCSSNISSETSSTTTEASEELDSEELNSAMISQELDDVLQHLHSQVVYLIKMIKSDWKFFMPPQKHYQAPKNTSHYDKFELNK